MTKVHICYICVGSLFLSYGCIPVGNSVSVSPYGARLVEFVGFLVSLAYLILQMEIASICFGISAFLSRGGQGLGLGIAALAYFLNIIANLTEDAGFLKYITPFGYAEGADIVAEGSLNSGYLAAGIALALLGIGAAFVWYQRKDIA